MKGKKAQENLTERVSLYKALCSDECWKEEIKLIGTMWYNYHPPPETQRLVCQAHFSVTSSRECWIKSQSFGGYLLFS